MDENVDIDISVDDVLPDVTPTLYEINKSFDIISTKNYSGIVGEAEARMVIFTNFILGEKPVILKGSRASGKTNIIRVCTAYAKNPVDIASSSEKAYQRNKKLNDFSHFIIPEINKVNEKTIEMLKDFGEGEQHQYTFTNPMKDTETIIIDPKPFITSIADENRNVDMLGEELLSRVTVVRTDSSIRQNTKVINEKLLRAANPFHKKDVSQDEVNRYIEYVQCLPSVRDFRFVFPAGQSIQTAIPPLFTDSRRDTDKYLANTYGISLFHYKDRLTLKKGKDEFFFVTPADIWYNNAIYQNILLESSLKCGRIEREIIKLLKEKDIDEVADEWGNKVRGLKVSEIHTHLINSSFTPTIDSVTKMCNQLMEIGYIIRNEEVKPYRYSINPEFHKEYKIEINWENVIAECKMNVEKYFPEIAEEYVSRFCVGDGLKVIDPFTGEERIITEDKVVIESEPVTKLDEIKRKNEALKKAMGQGTSLLDNLSEPVVVVEDTGTVVDKTDEYQDRIRDCVKNNDSGEGVDFMDIISITGIKPIVLQDNLKYLCKIGDLFENKPGRYKVLE